MLRKRKLKDVLTNVESKNGKVPDVSDFMREESSKTAQQPLAKRQRKSQEETEEVHQSPGLVCVNKLQNTLDPPLKKRVSLICLHNTFFIKQQTKKIFLSQKASEDIHFLIGLKTWEEVKLASKYLQSQKQQWATKETQNKINVTVLSSDKIRNALHTEWQVNKKESFEPTSYLKISGLKSYDPKQQGKSGTDSKKNWNEAMSLEIKNFVWQHFKDNLTAIDDIEQVTLFPNILKPQIHGYAYVKLKTPQMAMDIAKEFERQFHARYHVNEKMYRNCLQEWTKQQHQIEQIADVIRQHIPLTQSKSVVDDAKSNQSAFWNKKLAHSKQRIVQLQNAPIPWPPSIDSALFLVNPFDNAFWVQFTFVSFITSKKSEAIFFFFLSCFFLDQASANEIPELTHLLKYSCRPLLNECTKEMENSDPLRRLGQKTGSNTACSCYHYIFIANVPWFLGKQTLRRILLEQECHSANAQPCVPILHARVSASSTGFPKGYDIICIFDNICL
ncbi:hypothetical protein RFI_22939 [Reticulomyxa filosa]|uniref:RRM domain-containing protein n=1 Tax=Reticulomyxa filosa TaxID=46433 RepID=X6MMX9_RETFI|nr:hypothetical protein RFI_22939 [Reticulomyxa filosa]|eukprot:ETO14425.1 hypothetical protein RFI_22939 [Reticulomyxa filosa]